MIRSQITQILWESPNGKWMIVQHPKGERFAVFRSDIDCEVTPFDVYMPKYVDRAYSRLLHSKPYALTFERIT